VGSAKNFAHLQVAKWLSAWVCVLGRLELYAVIIFPISTFGKA